MAFSLIIFFALSAGKSFSEYCNLLGHKIQSHEIEQIMGMMNLDHELCWWPLNGHMIICKGCVHLYSRFLEVSSFLQLQYSCRGTHTVHFQATPLPLSVLSGTFTKWKLESKCQAARQNQFQVSSWTSSIVFFCGFAGSLSSNRERPYWCYCFMSPVVKATLYCGTVRRFLTHNDSYSALHLTSETSAEESSPPSSEPWSRPELCRPTGMMQISEVQKHALLAPHPMCSRVH